MVKTAHLQPELITFLRQLAKNNNREWFQKNKDRYDPTRPPPSWSKLAERQSRRVRPEWEPDIPRVNDISRARAHP